MLISFLLFRLAAGDPSAMLLGKNPSPLEIEDLRDRLSIDKAIFFGRWRRTESFSSVNFDQDRELTSLLAPPNATREKDCLVLPAGTKLILKRNFELSSPKLLAKIAFKGQLNYNGKKINPGYFGSHVEIFPKDQATEIVLTASENSRLYSIEFFKSNPYPFDSQMLNSLKELILFTRDFPYLSFFNFGKTLTTRERIDSVIWRSMWISLSLMLPIFILDNFFSIPIAMLAAVFRGRFTDKALTVISVCGMSISYIVLIVLAQWFLSYRLGLFPVWGFENASYLLLPVLIGTISGIGGSVRFYRTIFLNELPKDYIRTAFAKGLSDSKIYFGHVLKNAAVPIVARISTTLPFLFTGSLLLESFFGIPGLGFEAINALNNSDLQMLKALVLLTAILFVTFNLLADILSSYLDPRIRLE